VGRFGVRAANMKPFATWLAAHKGAAMRAYAIAPRNACT